MKTTIYDLLGMIKDGKAPKKIKYSSYVFKYTGDKRISRMYVMENQETYLFRDMVTTLTGEVEILETTITYNPTGNKIEKLEILNSELGEYVKNKEHNNCYISKSDKVIINKINEIIDRIN